MTILKRIGIILGGLIGLLVILATVLHFVGNSRLNNAPNEIVGKPVTIPTDAEAIAWGEHLATISSCNECHAPDLSGTRFEEGPPIGYLPAPNLTPSGIGGDYSDADWEMAIRHGVGLDGRTLTVMPSYHYDSYSDEDLGALIAYLKSVPAVEDNLGERAIAFPGTIFFGVFNYAQWGVAAVDHANISGTAPAQGATAEYGEYLLNITSCGSCHAENLAGNPDPNAGPTGPNITMGGALQGWSEADFFTLMRSGTRPTGSQASDEMPWQAYSHMSDEELTALWLYLQSVDALASNE